MVTATVAHVPSWLKLLVPSVVGHCLAEHLLCSKAIGHMGQSREIPSNPGNLQESWGDHAHTCTLGPSEV